MNRKFPLLTAIAFAICFVAPISQISAQDPFWANRAKENEDAARRYRSMADDPNAPGNTMHLREAARLAELNAQLQRDLANRPSLPQSRPSSYRPVPSNWGPSNSRPSAVPSHANQSGRGQQNASSSNGRHSILGLGVIVAGALFIASICKKGNG